MMLLFLSLLFLGGAAFVLGEVATYPARLKERSLKRASEYGRIKVRASDLDRLRFRERVLVPSVGKLAAIPLKLNPRTTIESIQAKLLAAGASQRLTPQTFLAIKGGATVGGVVLGFVLVAAGSVIAGIFFAPMLGAVGFIAPDYVLGVRARRRRDAIRTQLPDALDLLAVSVEAGLGFDGAVTKLTEHMQGALVDEFAMMLNEIRIGESRQAALKKMAERVEAPELATFVRAVVQADQLGISLGRILRVQAADSRLRRQAAAEEKAMKAPIKMLFPTVLFIFPAMFIVLLGPAMLNIMKVLK
ncbi:MAG: type II secretion system F family protein [Actinomycetota bacterium]|nr:type II secretion system F family protein [Actinomycetota bacterium]